MKTLMVLIYAAAFSVGACTSTYLDVSEDMPHAVLVLEEGKATDGIGFGDSRSQDYIIYPDADCSNPQRAADFSFGSGQSKTVRVASGEIISVVSVIADLGPNRETININDMDNSACSVMAQFTPLNGERYIIKGTGDGAVCDMKVQVEPSNTTSGDILVKQTQVDGLYKCNAG